MAEARAQGLPGALRAIAFDLDGTLYLQRPLRRAMLLALARAHLARPRVGLRTARALSAYRRAQERLRGVAAPGGLAAAQLRLAAEAAGLDERFVRACVERWMEREPLPLLRRCLRPGAVALLELCRRRGVRVGVLSDYPAEAKLEAMGLGGLFDAVLSAQSPEAGAFKPDPRGLRALLQRLGVAPEEALYVGDREDVDAVAAAAAGVRCVILTGARAAPGSPAFTPMAGFEELAAVVGAAPERLRRAPIAGGG